MHKSIYKYQLKVTDKQNVVLPVGAEILTVQSQNEAPCLWAMVDETEQRKTPRLIRTIGTGHPIEHFAGLSYIGTYQIAGGSFVFHIFEDIFK